MPIDLDNKGIAAGSILFGTMAKKLVLYCFMLGMLFSGTASTMLAKSMDLMKVNGKKFRHPYFQTASMFIGYNLFFLYYKVAKRLSKTLPEARNSLAFSIPAFLDVCAASLNFIGLQLSSPSVYQMVRGFRIVVVAIYSVLFLKSKLCKHHITGVALTVVGTTIVGISSVLYKDKTAQNPVAGFFLVLACQFFAAGVWVVEAKFLKSLKVHPMKAVAVEGASGLSYYIVILFVLYFVPCSDPDFCTNGRVEDSLEAFEQIGADGVLLVLWISVILSLSLLNWTGVSINKYGTPIARATVDMCRTTLVWLITILIGWDGFYWLQALGFLFIVLGTLLYNEILVLPCFRRAVEDSESTYCLVESEVYELG